MNDFERKISEQPFRPPPAELRAMILDVREKVIAPELAAWRDWLWPSPLAWAALAMIWAILYAIEAPNRNAELASTALHPSDQEIPQKSLLSFALERDRLLAEMARNRLTPGP